MPSILGKRKRGSALADHKGSHHAPTKPDARKAIVRTVEEQIDLERSMKLREIKATEARIVWAQAISEGIERGAAPSSVDCTRIRAAAMLSYWSIGSAYYSWPRPRAPAHIQDDDGLPGSSIPPPAPVDFPPMSDEVRTSVQQIIAKGNKPLLVKYMVDPRSEPVLLVLVCPLCKRADLSTVQGFYNHCRLAHQLTYAGHSECIEASGQLVSKDDIQSIGIDDVEIKGTGIPSVQRLFQRAVGVQPSAGSPLPQTLGQPARVSTSRSPSPDAVETHLNKTLGIHDETPALAQFLGTTARRRQIRVFDTGEDIDITTEFPEPRRFRWLYRQRRGGPTADMLEDDIQPTIPTDTVAQVQALQIPNITIPTTSRPLDQQSRFHISRRIIISDRSRYIPLSHRHGAVDTATHEWSLTITAPSYMPQISTFLKEATISTPAPTAQSSTLTHAPFTTSGKTKAPFLAQVRLSWPGYQNKDTTATHWVRLDPVKTGGWVAGDEQVLDVRLDKDTVFLAPGAH
ncbi:hypothetical protein CALVIDRAFT_539759 [Calocera viscosa TUFC12733]|uniref:YEATS domain-containing protein n=1 Tax=Calocera viscosa (strain TUFC12733) TaxID=1330018 RepID=A0A167JH58_CALVF|nr:hypothetical protein CALVIDRAFT_539759 [Calocera viscosa TUFC12733]